jgi:DNA-binding MarR family transcriptional regulator
LVKHRSERVVEEFVSYRLSVLSRLINRRSTRYFAEEFGMTLAEWRCLTQIAEGRGATISEIAERTFADKAQVSRAAQGLAGKKLIEGSSDPLDRRSVRYKITPKGRQMFQNLLALRTQENDAVLSLLNEEQKGIFFECLDILTIKFSNEDVVV